MRLFIEPSNVVLSLVTKDWKVSLSWCTGTKALKGDDYFID